MSKSVTIRGLSKTKLRMSRIGKVTHKRMLEAVRNAADEIVKEARLNAPVDEGNLEEAIDVLGESATGINRRLEIFVGVDPSKLGPGYTVKKYRYDLWTHEAEYNLGEASEAKGRSLGGSGGKIGRVGPKYLKRALDDVLPRLESRLAQIKREIAKS